MKKFLAKASKSLTPPNKLINIPSLTSAFNPTVTPLSAGLPPKYTVPAVPHPAPHAYLALLVTAQGILMRPHIPGETPLSYIVIPWHKTVKVHEVSVDSDQPGVNWDESVIVYGIVGILELFSASYLLVITSRTEIGTFFEPTHTVYGVKQVVSIPLVEDRARVVVNTLASRNAAISRPSLLPSSKTMDTISSATSVDTTDTEEAPGPSAGRVQFATTDQVKVMTPSPTTQSFPSEVDGLFRSSSPAPSDASGSSTPTSDSTSPTMPIAKAIAEKLSFWSRLSKRTPLFPSSDDVNRAGPPPPLDLDALLQDERGDPPEVIETILSATAPPPTTAEEKHSELEEKIIRECIREYTKGGMFFAYNFDITRSLQHKQDQATKSLKQNALLADLLPSRQSDASSLEGEKVNPFTEPFPTLPLWRRVDRQFWWNEHLSKPIVDAGLHPYVLPIMQGYYQIASFYLPTESGDEDSGSLVDYIVVSRRSRDRAGLRYQRRGVDDDAHVANFVETETVMQVERDGTRNLFSYVQIRGSIPLFWTQSGYGLKPPPVLAQNRTRDQNLDVMRRHFHRTIPQYGPHAIINLAEQQGKEGAITQAYREYVRELDDKDAQYNEYDFHSETKGMKYENISKLIDSMGRTFEQHGYLWISDNVVMSRQKGVFRVNCIDCLDRTNVVQSAFARHILNEQLSAVALHLPDVDGRIAMDVVINDVWANNGDAISRAYAGTSALKGDFTRTGKRDLTGLLNDGMNSLARMYSSTFSDWFSQAAIDFMLGYRTLGVFSEFLNKLQSSDPRDLIRLSKIRAEAIATSVERVLVEGERLLGGWTLFSPEELNTKMATAFEEKVLLLTGRALYIIRYDYTLEKVKLYTRVPLGDIVEISKGPYILSPLEEASRDPMQNFGFVISWLNSNQITRFTSYSIRNSLASPPASPTSSATVKTTKSPRTNSGIFDVRRNVLTATLSKKSSATLLSNILSMASLDLGNSGQTFAAFKVLPIDPTRRRMSSTVDAAAPETPIPLTEASSCKEAADLIVDSIRRACEDIGSGGHDGFLADKDIVSLAEAEHSTSMYAKMEYGVKRLLWLGS